MVSTQTLRDPILRRWTARTLSVAVLTAAVAAPLTDVASAAETELLVSSSTRRTSATQLHGAQVSGGVAVFATAPKATTQRVDFELDGTRIARERVAPYDAQGGTSRDANLLDTSSMADGEHTIRAEVGRPAEVVARLAVEHDASLAVVGAAGRRLMPPTLIGHTAERILSSTTISLLVVKAPGFAPVDDEEWLSSAASVAAMSAA